MENFNKFTIQQSFAISAGAGSGKTYTLSRRYINSVLGFDLFVENDSQKNFIELKDTKKADVSQIITMTYTEAAALEMKERIFDLMEKIVDFDSLDKENKDYDSIKLGMDKLKNQDEKSYVKNTLQEALHNSNNAFISTIHSFCLDTIKSNSDIAKLDSGISLITKDDEKQKILDEVKLDVLTNNHELAFKIFKQNDKFKVNQLIEKYVTNSKFKESFDNFINNLIDEKTYKFMILELYKIPDDLKDVFYFTRDYITENNIEDGQKYIDFINDYITRIFNFESIKWSDLLKEHELKFSFGSNPWKKYKEQLQEPINYIKQLDSFVSIYSKIDEEKEEYFTKLIKELQKLLEKIYLAYQERLTNENKMDFDTIISKTASIINDVQKDYKYIMVDEFQDTNSLQNKIVNEISKDINLFVVGDSKQSIYSFQGAELEVFNNAISNLKVEPMSVNFRSDKEILNFVNIAFNELFEQDNPKLLISSNYKASFTKNDELQANSKKDGKVEFLISEEENGKTIDNQMENIAKFIKSIKDGSVSGYEKIKEKIDENKKAIGIVFDSKTKMILLKKQLNLLGVECKVSATEDFYETKEINDIFLVLKSIYILNNKEYCLNNNEDNELIELDNQEKFFIAGSLRSNIFRYDEEKILNLFNLDIQNIIDIFKDYMILSKELNISLLIKNIVDDSKLLDIYIYLGDISQRASNIEKLINLAIEFEHSDLNDMKIYLEDLERNIYFNKNSKEDEAFYKSDNLESIELCTIHSTKGLAYPMIILAQSEKSLSANSTGEMGLSFSSFILNHGDEKIDYSAVGFKIGEYEPLVYRALKQISKNKHEAEKKRLLYVALTRAEHNLVIAGSMYRKAPPKATKKNPEPIGEISKLTENSYLYWLGIKSFELENEELFNYEEVENKLINFIKHDTFQNIKGDAIKPKDLEIEVYNKQEVEFKENSKKTASNTDKNISENESMRKQSKLGIMIHSIIEHHWEKLEDTKALDNIFIKEDIFNNEDKNKIKKYIANFIKTKTYQNIKADIEHHFEIELNMFDEEKNIQTQGIIDLLYYDTKQNAWIIVDFKSNKINNNTDLVKFAKTNNYDKQLEIYSKLCEYNNMKVVKKLLLFLENGEEIEL
jgi:ATP-dependent helicase/nuclease subunit A